MKTDYKICTFEHTQLTFAWHYDKMLKNQYGDFNMEIISRNDICKSANRIKLYFITFGHAKINETWCSVVTSPPYSRLYYITHGSAEICGQDGTKTILTPGKWFFFPAGYSFNFTFPAEMEHLYFHFKLSDFDGMDLFRFTEKPVSICEDDAAITKLKNIIASSSVADSIFIKQYVYGLISPIAQNLDIKDYSQSLLLALQYIKSNLSISLTIEKIAAAAYISKSSLAKKFRKELSVSVNKYVSDAVLSEAALRLITKNESILSISERYGFSDQFYFSRKFKQKFGMSPREYRKDVWL